MSFATRRHFLKLAGMGGSLSILGLSPLSSAAAKLAVNSYGGIYADAVNASFIAHYKSATGDDAEAYPDTPAAVLSKIQATMPNPDYQLFTATANDTLRAIELDLVEEIKPDKLPNLKYLPAPAYQQWDNKAISFSYGTVGFLYDSRAITTPPKDWQEFVERTIAGDFGRSVAVPSAAQAGVFETFLFPVVTAFGATMADPSIGFEKIKAMIPYTVKYYSDMAEVVQMMSTGEAKIAVYVDGRAWSFVDKNPWANFVVPARGGVFQSSQIMKVKNTADEAWLLMDAFMDIKASEKFVEMIRYPVTNMAVTYPDAMKDRTTRPEDILYPPFAQIQSMTPQLVERWNKEIGG